MKDIKNGFWNKLTWEQQSTVKGWIICFFLFLCMLVYLYGVNKYGLFQLQ